MSVGRPGNGRQMAPSLPTSSIDPPCSLRGLARKNNATQAKAWAEFPRPFGPKPAPNPTGTQGGGLAEPWVTILDTDPYEGAEENRDVVIGRIERGFFWLRVGSFLSLPPSYALFCDRYPGFRQASTLG